MPTNADLLKRIATLEETVSALATGLAEIKESRDRLEDIIHALSKAIQMQVGCCYADENSIMANGCQYVLPERFRPPTPSTVPAGGGAATNLGIVP